MFYGVRFSFSGEFLFTPSQLDNVQARVRMCGACSISSFVVLSRPIFKADNVT